MLMKKIVCKNIFNFNKFFKLYINYNDCFLVLDYFLLNKLFLFLNIFFNINKYTNIILVNSNFMLSLTKRYINKNKSTNVLSFKNIMHNNNLLGEIYLCPYIILLEIFYYKYNFFNYFLYILLHGFLHLLNFNHSNILEHIKMKFFTYFILNSII